MRQKFGVSVYKQKFNFCSAHFLIFADGSREALHGHNYRVWVEVDGPIGEGDMVIDFTSIKPLVKEICDELDHVTLLPENNPFLSLEECDGMTTASLGPDRFSFPSKDVLVLPLPNTSTERLAEYFCMRLQPRLPPIALERIRVYVEESTGQCGFYEERYED